MVKCLSTTPPSKQETGVHRTWPMRLMHFPCTYLPCSSIFGDSLCWRTISAPAPSRTRNHRNVIHKRHSLPSTEPPGSRKQSPSEQAQPVARTSLCLQLLLVLESSFCETIFLLTAQRRQHRSRKRTDRH